MLGAVALGRYEKLHTTEKVLKSPHVGERISYCFLRRSKIAAHCELNTWAKQSAACLECEPPRRNPTSPRYAGTDRNDIRLAGICRARVIGPSRVPSLHSVSSIRQADTPHEPTRSQIMTMMGRWSAAFASAVVGLASDLGSEGRRSARSEIGDRLHNALTCRERQADLLKVASSQIDQDEQGRSPRIGQGLDLPATRKP